ncbi:MAG: glycosyltransferase [Candidatus Pacearchaeota archaeon]
MFFYPKSNKRYSVSVLIPAYNEEDSIEETLKHVLKSDYDNIKEIIVINDGSTDNTKKIVENIIKKEKLVKLLDKKNSGKADSLNQAIKIAKGELVLILDADSYICEDAIRKMVGLFDDKKVASVTGRILVKNKEKLLERLQAAEYAMIAFSRKLLEFVDGIWVTPGALSMYRKSALIKVGGFDTKNITEDVEITWRLIKNGYKIKMCLAAGTYTIVPNNMKRWWRQRIRWDIGGIQTLIKYKGYLLKRGSLGYFIIPLFSISMFLGLFGLSVFFYLLIRKLILIYKITYLSKVSSVPILTMNDIYITVTVLNFFGIIVFLLGLYFTLIGLRVINPGIKKSFFNLLIYLCLYLSIYPTVLLVSFYKIIKKDIKW